VEVTSWLSNLIKWNYINLEHENRLIVSPEPPKNTPGQTKKTTEALKEKREKAIFKAPSEAVVLQAERDAFEAEKSFALAEARKQADDMISQAREAAENIKNDAYENGYASGMEDAKKAEEKLLEEGRQKLLEEREEQQNAYLEERKKLEVDIADFIVKMLEKLTGVLTEDKEEIILHLVRNGLSEAGKSKHFTVKVSPEDYPMIDLQRERLYMLVDSQEQLSFQEDKELRKNQCVIETDSAVIESSLDVQLKKLREDIRLMALSTDD
jgi:flagellar assembly protein FliH